LFIEEEKYKALLTSQKIVDLRKRRGAKQEKKPNSGKDLEVCRKRKSEHHQIVVKINERKFFGKLWSTHPPASEVEETNSERKQNSEIRALPTPI
jgi:hypothetical protein